MGVSACLSLSSGLDTLPGNTDYDQPVSSLDIVATVAAAAGISLPTDRVYDGINLIPYLTGQQISPKERCSGVGSV